MVYQLTTIDAHVGGQAFRLIVGGVPSPAGRTMAQRQDWLRRHADHLRRAAVLEPRGHPDMTAALLTEPCTPGAHAGMLVMDAEGGRAMSGHGVIAATTIALERDLLTLADPSAAEVRVVFDTPAGVVPARARLESRGGSRRVDAVAFTSVPSFVHAPACSVRIGTRELRVDVAYGGEFYAIVDTEATGIPLVAERLPEIRRLGAGIRRALSAERIVHPVDPARSGVAGVVLTGPPRDPEAHLRNVVVTGGGVVNRSPSGTGTAAVMAVLDAMGLLPDDQVFVHESLTGERFRGRVLRRSLAGDAPAIVAEIEGTAWITGDHTLCMDEDDPLRDGLRPG